MSLIRQYLRDVQATLNRQHRNKLGIMLLYHRLLVRNIIVNKILQRPIHMERIGGQRFSFGDYSSFFGTFVEVFFHQTYHVPLPKKPRIIDAGANIGITTAYFKELRPQAEVLCFEPDKHSFGLLQKNIQNNNWKKVSTQKVALSEKKGKTTFYEHKNTKGSTGGSIASYHNDKSFEKTTVETDRLSNHMQGSYDLLKMDIEGGETAVFEDLDKSSKIKDIRQIIFEFHYSPDSDSNSLGKILSILEKNGFNYIIDFDAMIGRKKTLEQYHKRKRYVLIIRANQKKQ